MLQQLLTNCSYWWSHSSLHLINQHTAMVQWVSLSLSVEFICSIPGSIVCSAPAEHLVCWLDPNMELSLYNTNNSVSICVVNEQEWASSYIWLVRITRYRLPLSKKLTRNQFYRERCMDEHWHTQQDLMPLLLSNTKEADLFTQVLIYLQSKAILESDAGSVFQSE